MIKAPNFKKIQKVFPLFGAETERKNPLDLFMIFLLEANSSLYSLYSLEKRNRLFHSIGLKKDADNAICIDGTMEHSVMEPDAFAAEIHIKLGIFGLRLAAAFPPQDPVLAFYLRDVQRGNRSGRRVPDDAWISPQVPAFWFSAEIVSGSFESESLDRSITVSDISVLSQLKAVRSAP